MSFTSLLSFADALTALRTRSRRLRSALLPRLPEHSLAVETLAAAVATVLVTRLFLEWTGYPQLGNDTLHVAHVLWGGLLMLVAGWLALDFHGADARRLGAVLLGVGFGLFIDEIGKFVTQDNDYFFRPAAALIYASFVLLFLAIRTARRLAPPDDRSLLLAAVDALAEAARGALRPDQQAAALAALDRVAAADSAQRDLARQLRALLAQQAPVAPPPPGRAARRLAALHARLTESPRHRTWLLRAVIAAALLGLLDVAGSSLGTAMTGASILLAGWSPGPDFTAATLQAFGSVVAGAFFLRGLREVRRDLAAGLRHIGTGFTVTILVVNVFAFYFHQFGATTGALTGLLLLRGVRALQAGLTPGARIGARRAASP